MELDPAEIIELEKEKNMADILVGGLWIEFREAVPPLQAKILDRAFNLIMTTDQDSILPNQVANTLLNDSLDTSIKKQSLYVLFAVNIMSILTEMGMTLDDNVAGEDKLKEMCTIIEFFMELREYEDLIGLKNLLECSDIPPINRFFSALTVYWGEEFDISEFECLVIDVSEVTIKAIKDALFSPDDMSEPPDTLKRRILENREFLVGTKAHEHVTNNGQLGGSMVSFLNFFKDYMDGLLVEGGNSVLVYAKEVLAFYIISDVNDEWLKEQATKYLYSVVDDLFLLTKVEGMIDQVVIKS